jgi:hypothetical protein
MTSIDGLAFAAPTAVSADEKTCWICGNAATSGEHKAKRSDLKAVFRKPTQARPLYIHERSGKTRRIGSLDAWPLKWADMFCEQCNTTRTQPHDRAWERLSECLRAWRPPLTPGMTVRGNRVFVTDTRQEMLNVHLYFAKMFGCGIVEGAVPIDITAFSKAILNQKAHPNFYLQFGVAPAPGGRAMVSASNPEGLARKDNGRLELLTWIYNVNGLRVAMIFAADADTWAREQGLWHPRIGTNRLVIRNFE